MRRPPLVKVALLGAVAALIKRRTQSKKAERELWNEATAPADKS